MLTKHAKILVVDDLPVMRKIIAHLLKQLGLKQVVMVSNGEAALSALQQEHFDLVLCDWKMPVMDGLAVYRKIREQESLKALPFILVTAEGNQDKVMEAIRAGVNNYIVKPLTAKILKEKIVQTMNA